ncbi:MAG: galactosyltransferase-related protein [Parvularcula sp.]|jgi:GT2 family glycosyltransferase|nr:galactosyltransferase-related protein [Parvularcula sp.]
MTTSILTLVRGREDHLIRMLEGCVSQSQPADEIIVALMGGTSDHLPSHLAEACRFISVPGEKLPLAAARNAAADSATGDDLLFLDVDCIPAPDFVEHSLRTRAPHRVLMGDCRYLARGEAEEKDFQTLWARAERHPARPLPSNDEGSTYLVPMTEFWSLVFALPKALFEDTGGFDEDFIGYGGEDTDFARRLAQVGAELHFVPDLRAVHQWHEVSIPPLQHFGDIIRNAELFRRKHGVWCMDYWLGQLKERGFIRVERDHIALIKEPSRDELEAARQPASVRFS